MAHTHTSVYLLHCLYFSGSFTCSSSGRLPPLFLPSLFLLCLTLTVIILWIGVTASEEVRLTGNPDFLLSQHLITVEKTHDFSIHISQCPTYTACSQVNWGPALKFSQKFPQLTKNKTTLDFYCKMFSDDQFRNKDITVHQINI